MSDKGAAIQLTVSRDRFATDGTFTISRGSRTEVNVVTVSLQIGDHIGMGECVPYARYGESMDSVCEQIKAFSGVLAAGEMDRMALQDALAPGAARNALDCAFWDLEAKCSGKPVWELAGLPKPEPVTTAFTLSLDTPENMLAAARKNAFRPLLKLKLGGEGDLERLTAVRTGAPDCRLIVDANEGWTGEDYDNLAPRMLELGVALVEQPLPAGSDDALNGRARPLPVCADEACHDRNSLASLAGRYDVINIKLDKTGGLTEALAMRTAARAQGFGIMVGCMVGSSLAMAPAHLVAQSVEFVDLDGPLLLAEDRELAIRYEGSKMYGPTAALWG
ncbi:N-acetyl-D-Glu racemase DgcA [Granulosicoccus antarcticus]|uniref:Dipeptide epimerase n=1 Tax=Granulosicoccus antarcticus IMCC3135 TaxID=1192854 RepID=A0A2Z2NMV0_9GAMM|nr:N-acetyl-D-Glu racemase DgcA [Granulosicoccus antarcticus]ASJ72549.1 L-Ala-D/L-Glu epimerase [Granulosicoccus antarcticus IMCC3135]